MAESELRNILMIFTDEHRRDTLGCYGNKICKTKNIDSLADNGAVFSNAFTPTAVCTPARASLLTGVYPQKHLLMTNPKKTWGPPAVLNEKFPPFSHYLKQAGYQLGNVGKWHIGKTSPLDYGFLGLDYQGWDETRDHPDYLEYLKGKGLSVFSARDEIRGLLPNGKPGTVIAGIYDGPVTGTFTYYLVEKAIAKLKELAVQYKQNQQPFYLSCHIFGPHLPYYLPREYADMYNPDSVVLPGGFRETFDQKPHIQKLYSQLWSFNSFSPDQWRKIIAWYWGYVTMIDEQIGRLLGILEELNLAKETTVFFSTDHGSFEGSHRLNDKGPAAYDDIYRIPLIIRYPGVSGNRVDEHLVTLMDLTATFLDIAGLKAQSHFDGSSLLPFLKMEPVYNWRDDVYMEFHGHQVPYAQRVIRTKEFKLIYNVTDICELYDLRNDPDELINRFDDPDYEAIKRNLFSRLYRRLNEIGDTTVATWLEYFYEV